MALARMLALRHPRMNDSCHQMQRGLHYVQGQSPESKVREYFYFIDHQGQLFLDDARIKNFTSCFKEKKFLQFFFARLQRNETNRFNKEFPFLSLCGRERNFVRCDDVPIVFTELLLSASTASPSSIAQATTTEESQLLDRLPDRLSDRLPDRFSDRLPDQLSYSCAGELLTVPFLPAEITMLPSTGRVYHPGPERCGGVGLIKSSLAIALSKEFEFRNGEGLPPTHFRWHQTTFSLTNSVLAKLELMRSFLNLGSTNAC